MVGGQGGGLTEICASRPIGTLRRRGSVASTAARCA